MAHIPTSNAQTMPYIPNYNHSLTIAIIDSVYDIYGTTAMSAEMIPDMVSKFPGGHGPNALPHLCIVTDFAALPRFYRKSIFLCFVCVRYYNNYYYAIDYNYSWHLQQDLSYYQLNLLRCTWKR